MKKQEILLALKRNQEIHIQLNIVSNLQNDLGKGDSLIVNGRKSIQSIIESYNSAISVYQSIIPQADRYIDMAKSLGEATIQKQLEDVKKQANEMIKTCNSSISKLKSV